MRKRLIIGAVSAVVIGVATYVLSRPKEGTVEWYKREYARAIGEAYGIEWFTPIEDVYRRIINQPRRSRILSREAIAHLKRGEEARLTLHSMGFLSVRRFTITNVLREEAAAIIWKQRESKLSRDEELFVNFTYPTTDTNMLVIEGVAKEMAEWEAAVRQVYEVRPDPKTNKSHGSDPFLRIFVHAHDGTLCLRKLAQVHAPPAMLLLFPRSAKQSISEPVGFGLS